MVNLHNHSEYSLLDGLTRVKEMASRAKELGQPACAVTEHGNLHSMVKFYRACRDIGIKPIIGCEVYVCEDRTSKAKETRGQYNHLVLLARNHEGLSNLIKIVSDASLVGFYQKPRTDISFLREHGRGLIALSACRAGRVPELILTGMMEEAKAVALEYSGIFDRFYLELEASDTEAQFAANRGLVALAKETGLPLVVTNDSHYLMKEDSFHHEILLAIQTGKSMSDPERFKLDSNCYWFKSEEETRSMLLLSDLPESVIDEAIANTDAIAEECSVELPLGRTLFPKVDVPEGHTSSSYLRKEAFRGLERLVSEFGVDEKTYRERLEYELGVIEQAGLGDYFLMVQDIQKAAERMNIPRGPGRGSAGGCLLSRCLGITQVDPIKHNLSFERFWVPGRSGLPDIDLDYSPDRRRDLFQYVIDKYGVERCAHIATFGTLSPKLLVRDIGRALDIPLSQVEMIAKAVPDSISDEQTGEKVAVTIDRALEESADLQKWQEQYPLLFEVARKLEGLPRHTSVHAAGIVIAPVPLFGEAPLMRNKDEDDPLPITQFDMGDVEEWGLVKMDLLGVDALTVVANCLETIRERTGESIDLVRLPLDDAEVYKMICETRTFGLFQVCTNVGKQICSQVQPETFDELIDVLAIARPGPMKSGQDNEYVIHKLGVKPVEYIHPKLEPILSSTYGVMLYQEQLMAITRELAGFSYAEADKVRKAVAKKHPEVLKELRTKFVEGCKAQGTLDEDKANELWSQMEKYGGYVFNKSHACAYAYITYWTAWLKVHYPVEFMAATLTNEYLGNGPDRDQKVVDAMLECRRLGIKVLQPNINESRDRFQVVSKDSIRFPLSAIKGVGEKAVASIIENAPYESFEDFVMRVPKRSCNSRVIQILVLAGVFDFMNPDRLELIRAFDLIRHEQEEALRLARRKTKKALKPLKEKPPSTEVKVDSKTVVKLPKKYTLREKLEWEKILLGTYISCHPLDQLGLDRWKEKRVGQMVTVAGTVYSHKTVTIKRGKSIGREMCICNIDTTEGSLTVVLFPDEFEKYKPKIRKNNIIKVKGILDERNKELQIKAKEVTLPKIEGLSKSGGTKFDEELSVAEGNDTVIEAS